VEVVSFFTLIFMPPLTGGRADSVYPVRVCICMGKSFPAHNLVVHGGISK